MGLFHTVCFFIAIEQIILSNIQVIRSADSFIKYGYNTYTLVQSFFLILQVFVAFMLISGLLERKSSKLISWLFFNAFICMVFTVTMVTIYFDSSLLLTIFGYSHSSLYIILTVLLVLQWVTWITVLKYYKYLKLKELKCRATLNKHPVLKTEQTTVSRNTENELQSLVHKERYVQQDKEEKENIPLNRLYPLPSAPPDV